MDHFEIFYEDAENLTGTDIHLVADYVSSNHSASTTASNSRCTDCRDHIYSYQYNVSSLMATYPNRLLHFYIKAIGKPGMVNTMSGTIPSDVYLSTTRSHRPSRNPVPASAAFMQELPPVPPPLPGAGTVSISGYEQFVWECPEGGFSFSSLSITDGSAMPMSPGDGCYRVYDGGALTLTVNGVNKTVSYGYGSTAANRAAALAQAINADPSFPVFATYTSGSTSMNLTSRQAGNYTCYPMSATWQSYWGFDPPSFSMTLSGSSLTGCR